MGFSGGSVGKESACSARDVFDPWIRKIPWRRKWHSTLIFLPGESHGQRNLAGYSPWGCKELDTTEQLNTHTHFFDIFSQVALIAQTVKNLPAVQETQVQSLGQGDPLEKGMATHSSILAWGIPWTEEPGGL